MAGMLRALALRPPWPYVGEVVRSLLGILLSVLVALELGSAAGAIAAGLSGRSPAPWPCRTADAAGFR